jgi:hypothetical protein
MFSKPSTPSMNVENLNRGNIWEVFNKLKIVSLLTAFYNINVIPVYQTFQNCGRMIL